MIQGFRHVARKIIQEKYNMHLAMMRHPQEGQEILRDIHAGVCGHVTTQKFVTYFLLFKCQILD
jgi:hypothetical protein